MGTPRKPTQKREPSHTHGHQHQPDMPEVSKLRSQFRRQRNLASKIFQQQIEKALAAGDAKKAAKLTALEAANKEIIVRAQLRAIAADILPEAAAMARRGKYRLLATVAEILERTSGKINTEKL